MLNDLCENESSNDIHLIAQQFVFKVSILPTTLTDDTTDFVSSSVTGPRRELRLMIDIIPSIITNDYQRPDPVSIIVNPVKRENTTFERN